MSINVLEDMLISSVLQAKRKRAAKRDCFVDTIDNILISPKVSLQSRS